MTNSPLACCLRLRRVFLARSAACGASVLLAALMGCGDDNPAKPGPVVPKYLPSSTPQNLLSNMQQAYTSRDSTAYDSLFDAAYVGTTTDPGDPGSPFTFTKADESLHIRALARSAAISYVNLRFSPNLVRFTDTSDPLGWATIEVIYPIVQVIDANTNYIVNPNESMEFKFRPTTPAPGSPTDTTWRIVRWSEVAP